MTLLLLCLTAADLLSARCDTGCKWAGYDGGYALEKQCVCLEARDMESTTREKKMTLSSRRARGAQTENFVLARPSGE